MSVKLTKRLVDAAEAADGRDTYLWDSEVRGLGLRVQRTGGAKAFVLKYGMGRRGLTRNERIICHSDFSQQVNRTARPSS